MTDHLAKCLSQFLMKRRYGEECFFWETRLVAVRNARKKVKAVTSVML